MLLSLQKRMPPPDKRPSALERFVTAMSCVKPSQTVLLRNSILLLSNYRRKDDHVWLFKVSGIGFKLLWKIQFIICFGFGAGLSCPLTQSASQMFLAAGEAMNHGRRFMLVYPLSSSYKHLHQRHCIFLFCFKILSTRHSSIYRFNWPKVNVFRCFDTSLKYHYRSYDVHF